MFNRCFIGKTTSVDYTDNSVHFSLVFGQKAGGGRWVPNANNNNINMISQYPKNGLHKKKKKSDPLKRGLNKSVPKKKYPNR